MSRLAESLVSSRFGGWALVQSPPQRRADGGQHWSLLIVMAAALVAMMAVVFDIRISSGPEPTAGLPSTTTIEQAEAIAVPQRSVAPPSTTTSEPTQGERSTTDPTTAASLTERAGEAASAEMQSTQTARSRVESTQTASVANERPAQASEPAGAAAVAVDDPASRIRDYLGLHPGAQLPVSFSYEVQSGDTASSIAERFGLEETTVLFNNWDIYDPNLLTPGQLLKLPPVNGLVYTVQSGDTFDVLMDRYLADRDATLSYPANSISSPDQIQVGQQILLVHGSASLPAVNSGGGSPSVAQSAQTWEVPTFVLYLKYWEISDFFGTARANSVGYHTGVDYVADVGELIGAAAGGVVSVATWDPLYGNWVEIDHGGGYRSRYAHLDIINVHEGQWVEAGAYIGTVGNTGNSSGAHLHFEIIVNGQAVNPLAWLN